MILCVIYSCWSAVPEDRELSDGAAANRDGAGICWIENLGKSDARVRWIKGLESDVEAVKKVIRDTKIKFPYAIHFRTASIGGVCEELTHPFSIVEKGSADLTKDLDKALDQDGTARRVLMHNGHLNSWKQWLLPIMIMKDIDFPPAPWSDSRALAVAVSLKGEAILEFIREDSRVMILDSIPSKGTDPKKLENYFRLFGSWNSHDGYAQSCVTPARRVFKDSRKDEACTRYVCPAPQPTSDNVWSIQELEKLVADVKAEQTQAKILLGC